MAIEFKEWITEKISEWLKTGKSETQLALALDISQATLNSWKNGTRKRPTDREIKNKLINFFGNTDKRVYIVLEEPGHYDPAELANIFSQTSKEDFEILYAALAAAESSIISRGINPTSHEAAIIKRDALIATGIFDKFN